MIHVSVKVSIDVDIAKKKFDVASFIDGKYKHINFPIGELGYINFVTWFLLLCGDVRPLICLEATGAYSLLLADFLATQGYAISISNPAKIHVFTKSQLSRAKTDKADAKLIARYALTIQPPL